MAASKNSQPKKRSTVRHTRAIQHDRTKRSNSMPLDPQVSEHLTQLIHPYTLGQVAHFHHLGLRQRLLTLPVMVALVLTIFRQLTEAGVTWVTRAKSNLVYRVERSLLQTSQVRDELVWIGSERIGSWCGWCRCWWAPTGGAI